MKLSGSRQLAAAPHVVWSKLNDAETLRRAIPGCESLEKVSDTDLKATVALKVGPMSARFTGDVKLSDLDPPRSYRISGSGKGGPAGMASGGANVRLEPRDGGTFLSYDVDAQVSGKIAQLGQRLIDATAQQLAERFFTNFAREVEGPALAAAVPAGSAAPVAPRKSAGGGAIWWLIGAAVLAAAGMKLLGVY